MRDLNQVIDRCLGQIPLVDGTGYNHLGRLLMQVRTEIQNRA